MGSGILLRSGEHEADAPDVEKGQTGDFEEKLQAKGIAVERDSAGDILNGDGDLAKRSGFESHEGEYIATSDLDARDGAGVQAEAGGSPGQNESANSGTVFGRAGLNPFVEF